MLARSPDVEFTLEQRERHRHSVAADRLGQRDDVGNDSGLFEGEERAGTAATHLDVVDDQQDSAIRAQCCQRPKPFGGASDIDATFTLHGFDDHCRGGAVDSTAGIIENAGEPLEVLGDAVEVVVEGHRCRVHEGGDTGAARFIELPVTESAPSVIP